MTNPSNNLSGWIRWNLANMLTLSRLTVFVILVPAIPVIWKIVWLILLAITDVLDGWWARHVGNASGIGKLLDAMADKIMAGVAAAFLLQQGVIEAQLALLILAGEIVVFMIAGYAAFLVSEHHARFGSWSMSAIARQVRAEAIRSLAVRGVGKIKIICYALGMVFALPLTLVKSVWLERLSDMFLYAGLTLAVPTVIYYILDFAAWQHRFSQHAKQD